jgi:hypothetical protein
MGGFFIEEDRAELDVRVFGQDKPPEYKEIVYGWSKSTAYFPL